jgi:mycofactocin system transcriptional regulator
VTDTARRGRPPGTSRRELELIALRLFTEQGYDETTVDQIAEQAGISGRTFFRYFTAKSEVLFAELDTRLEVVRTCLDRTPDDVPMMRAVRDAVVRASHYLPAEVPELRARTQLLAAVPELSARTAGHYAAWERVVAEFVARRTDRPAGSLYPVAVGRATLATCRAAYDTWVERPEADLTVSLEAALRALEAGFDPVALPPDAG